MQRATRRGEAAATAFALAGPLVATLVSAEPGVVVRSIAVDLERPRVTATLEPTTPAADARPRVVRIDDGALLRRLIAASRGLADHLALEAGRLIALRGESSGDPEAGE